MSGKPLLDKKGGFIGVVAADVLSIVAFCWGWLFCLVTPPTGGQSAFVGLAYSQSGVLPVQGPVWGEAPRTFCRFVGFFAFAFAP